MPPTVRHSCRGVGPRRHSLRFGSLVCNVKVRAHLLLVTIEGDRKEADLPKRRSAQGENFRQYDPFDLSLTAGTFVILNRGVEQSDDLLAHGRAGHGGGGPGHWVVLLQR